MCLRVSICLRFTKCQLSTVRANYRNLSTKVTFALKATEVQTRKQNAVKRTTFEDTPVVKLKSDFSLPFPSSLISIVKANRWDRGRGSLPNTSRHKCRADRNTIIRANKDAEGTATAARSAGPGLGHGPRVPAQRVCRLRTLRGTS